MGPMTGASSTKVPRARATEAAYWNRLLVVMRESPGNIARAARAMGSDRKTVRRIWTQGVPGTAWGARPMKDVLEAEQIAAAATRVEEDGALAVAQTGPSPAEVSAARRDAIETRGEEAKLVKAARANGIALQAAIANLSKAALDLSRRIETVMKNDDKITAGQAMLFMSRWATIVQRGVYCADTIIELEREVLGDPEERKGRESAMDADALTDAEAREILERAARAHERLRERGLRVVKGGQSSVGVQVTEPPIDENDDPVPETPAPATNEGDPDGADPPNP